MTEVLRVKTVRSLGLDDKNLFVTEIHESCKSKEVVDVKMKGHLIGPVLTKKPFFINNDNIWLCHNSPDN